jgi:choline dehydrogenase-like flavoprotein
LLRTVFSASAAPGYAVTGPGSGSAFHARAGMRVTTADAYLRPGAERSELTVLTDAVVDRLMIARGRMTGVPLRTADGPREVGVDEVVLSASAIGSSTILLLSGSAPPTSRAVSGLDATVGLPAVGRNPADHPVLWQVLQRTRGMGLVG